MQAAAFNATETLGRLSLFDNIPKRNDDEHLRLLLSHIKKHPELRNSKTDVHQFRQTYEFVGIAINISRVSRVFSHCAVNVFNVYGMNVVGFVVFTTIRMSLYKKCVTDFPSFGGVRRKVGRWNGTTTEERKILSINFSHENIRATDAMHYRQ